MSIMDVLNLRSDARIVAWRMEEVSDVQMRDAQRLRKAVMGCALHTEGVIDANTEDAWPRHGAVDNFFVESTTV